MARRFLILNNNIYSVSLVHLNRWCLGNQIPFLRQNNTMLCRRYFYLALLDTHPQTTDTGNNLNHSDSILPRTNKMLLSCMPHAQHSQ